MDTLDLLDWKWCDFIGLLLTKNKMLRKERKKGDKKVSQADSDNFSAYKYFGVVFPLNQNDYLNNMKNRKDPHSKLSNDDYASNWKASYPQSRDIKQSVLDKL